MITIDEMVTAWVKSELRQAFAVKAETACELLQVSPTEFKRLNIPKIKFGTAKQAAARWRVCDIIKYLEENKKEA